MSDAVTVVRARGRRLAKLVRADGAIEAYDSARTYDLFTQPVANLPALERLLLHLLRRPDCAVVRGRIIDPSRTERVRRLVHPDPTTGELPTLEESPRRWLALDLDITERPVGIEAADLRGCAAMAVRELPNEFNGVTCIAQATASHGLKPGIRLRLWFWLSRSTHGPELTRWLRSVAVDHSVFRPSQLIFTAAPIFENPNHDAVPVRMVTIRGDREAVVVPTPAALATPPPRPAVMTVAWREGSSRYASAALMHAATRVMAKTEGQRHDALLHEARGLARLVRAGVLSEADIRATLLGAGLHVGKPAAEVDSLIAWALAHPAAGLAPEGGR